MPFHTVCSMWYVLSVDLQCFRRGHLKLFGDKKEVMDFKLSNIHNQLHTHCIDFRYQVAVHEEDETCVCFGLTNEEGTPVQDLAPEPCNAI